MFTRARLRIAGLYVALSVLIVVLVAGSLVLLAARDARRTADLELRLRAEGLAAQVRRDGTESVAPRREDRRDHDEDEESEHEDDGRGLERAGILSYVLPVVGGQLAATAPGGIEQLPDRTLAEAALLAGAGQFATRAVPEGRVRLYTLPVRQGDATTAVIQVVRSQSFVDATVRRLLTGLFVSAAVGLVLAVLAGYWLAGRTLRPIADAFRRQRDFIADASHELRTPLTVIRGNIDHIRRHPERAVSDYDEVMADIETESERLGRLVAGLLTLARADEGRGELHWSAVDLSDLARSLTREMTPLAAAKGLVLRSSIEEGVIVEGDRDRLRELGLILLDNAIRYTTAGTVSLDLRTAGPWIEVTVQDTGSGIEPAHLPRVFDRFYRTPAARAAEAGGTGLGLAIARWIAEAHGGRVAVQSAVNHGSTFTVSLPRHTAAPRHTADRSGHAPPA